MQPVLEVKDLNVEFSTPHGTIHALQDLSFNVAPGDVVGIVGESGSGKSTVVWSIARLLAGNGTIASGNLRFNGRDIREFSDSELQHYRGEQVSIVFQDPMTSQNPVLTYARQMSDIQYRRGNSGADRKRRAIEAMKRVGIPDPEQRIGSYPHHFSGGMRQRAGIAMALMMDPALLIADEATTALDVTMEAQIIHLIRELKSEIAGSVIVVSHNLGLVAELCDRVVVMYAGKIVEQGTTHQIFHNPQHPYTQALLECDPARIEQRRRLLPTIAGDVPRLNTRQTGCGFADRCRYKFDDCASQIPPQHTVEDNHSVHCHLYSNADAPKPTPTPLAAIESDSDALEKVTTTVKNADSDEVLLRVDALNVRYQTGDTLLRALRLGKQTHVDAVIDASLHLNRGETLGIVGESGSGKTSLGRAILRLIPITSGSISFDGQQLHGLPESKVKPLRRNMAMMFQDPNGSLSPRKTIKSLLGEPYKIFGIKTEQRRSAVQQLLDMVGLPADFINRYPHELSGGQARRVGVARALALNPKLVVADEPTAGLDVSVQGEVLNLMAKLQAQHGLSYLIISHNLPVIRHVCDRVAIMYLGRIVEQGSCDDIFNAPAHPYTEALINSVPQPDPDKRRKLVSIAGEVPSLQQRPQGCEFHPRCAYARDVCQKEIPETTTVNGARTIRCHFPLQTLR